MLLPAVAVLPLYRLLVVSYSSELQFAHGPFTVVAGLVALIAILAFVVVRRRRSGAKSKYDLKIQGAADTLEWDASSLEGGDALEWDSSSLDLSVKSDGSEHLTNVSIIEFDL